MVFFPGLGWKAEDGLWNLEIRGWVFEKERRPGASRLLMKYLALDPETLSSTEKEIFATRSKLFLIDAEHGKKIDISLGGTTHSLSPSLRDGYFSGTIRLPEAVLEPLRTASIEAHVPFHLHYRDTNVTASGFVELLSAEGLSVVSDIDDTIKISDVVDREKLLRNTFLGKFEPVPGMAELYRAWRTNEGAAFHYVSASPYQLYLPLAEFLAENQFPRGSFHLRSFNLQNGIAQLTHGPDAYKLSTIEPLLLRFPKRAFVLVGDSGEHDPEIYGQLARKFPNQIRHIYIRDVTAEDLAAERYAKAFADLPSAKWSIFSDAGKLVGSR